MELTREWHNIWVSRFQFNAGRSAIRGLVEFPNGHGFECKYYMYFGSGIRYAYLPCDEKSLYWFCIFVPSVIHCKFVHVILRIMIRGYYVSMFNTSKGNTGSMCFLYKDKT